MGIELFDFLYNRALAMLGYMDAINASLDTTLENITLFQGGGTTTDDSLGAVNDSIDAVIAYITAEDYTHALAVLGATKEAVTGIRAGIGITNTSISSMGTVVSEVSENTSNAAVLINSLIPLITAEVVKCYDPTKTYNYKCEVCSIKCMFPLKYVPLDAKALKYCFLKNDNSALFTQRDIITTNP